MATLPSDWLTHFQILLKNSCRSKDLPKTWHRCSLWCSDQVLLLYKWIRNPIWLPWSMICWQVFNFFSRTTAGIYSKLSTDVPYGVPTKCCYFLSGCKVEYSWHGLWLADTFLTSSQEQLQGSTSNLAQMFLMGSRQSVVTF